MAVIAYYRVSAVDQSIIENLYNVDKTFIDEDISGTIAAMKREGFSDCVKYLREGDTLIVWDLDRLGRDSIDVQLTIKVIKEKGVNIKIHQMGIDLTTDAGELLVVMLSKVAEIERKKILARTQAGREAAKAAGNHLGRPSVTSADSVAECRNKGLSIANTANELGISSSTVKRLTAVAKVQGLIN